MKRQRERRKAVDPDPFLFKEVFNLKTGDTLLNYKKLKDSQLLKTTGIFAHSAGLCSEKKDKFNNPGTDEYSFFRNIEIFQKELPSTWQEYREIFKGNKAPLLNSIINLKKSTDAIFDKLKIGPSCGSGKQTGGQSSGLGSRGGGKSSSRRYTKSSKKRLRSYKKIRKIRKMNSKKNR